MLIASGIEIHFCFIFMTLFCLTVVFLCTLLTFKDKTKQIEAYEESYKAMIWHGSSTYTYVVKRNDKRLTYLHGKEKKQKPCFFGCVWLLQKRSF